MTNRGDWITLGVLGALAAGAAARGRRGGRNVTEAQSRQLYQAIFPSMQDLTPRQLAAMKQGDLDLPDGTPYWDARVHVLNLHEIRGAEAYPQTMATIRGDRFGRHRLKVWPDEGEVSRPRGIGAVLELEHAPEDGEEDYPGDPFYFYLPSTFEIVEG